MKILVATLAVAGLLVGSGMAQDKAAGPAPGSSEVKAAGGDKSPPDLRNITLSGKITKEMLTTKSGEPVAAYFITDAVLGRVRLPERNLRAGRKGEAAATPVINLDDYLDQDVKLIVKGAQRVWVAEIVNVERSVGSPPPSQSPATIIAQ